MASRVGLCVALSTVAGAWGSLGASSLRGTAQNQTQSESISSSEHPNISSALATNGAVEISPELGAESQWRPPCQAHADCYVGGRRGSGDTYCDRDHGCATHKCRNPDDSVTGKYPWLACQAHADCYRNGKSASDTYCDRDHGCAPHPMRNPSDSVNGKFPWDECNVHRDCYVNGKSDSNTYCASDHTCAPHRCYTHFDSIDRLCPWDRWDNWH